jgi:hypothetical protein
MINANNNYYKIDTAETKLVLITSSADPEAQNDLIL